MVIFVWIGIDFDKVSDSPAYFVNRWGNIVQERYGREKQYIGTLS